MKVTMLTHMAGRDFELAPGDVAERPDDEAIRLIARGDAQPYVDGPSPERAVTAPVLERRDIQPGAGKRKRRHGR